MHWFRRLFRRPDPQPLSCATFPPERRSADSLERRYIENRQREIQDRLNRVKVEIGVMTGDPFRHGEQH